MAGVVIIAGCRASLPDAHAVTARGGTLVVRAVSAEDTATALPMLEVWAWPAGRGTETQPSAHVRQDDGQPISLGPLPAGEYRVRIASLAHATQWVEVEIVAHCTDTLVAFIPRSTRDLVEVPGPRGHWRRTGCARGT